MLQFRNLLFFLLFAVIQSTYSASSSYSATSSGPFYVAGGVVGPGQKFELFIDAKNVRINNNLAVFNLTCHIENQSYWKAYPVILKMTYNLYGSTPLLIALNGHGIFENQGKFDQLDNLYEVKHFNIYKDNTYSSKIWFENMDDTDPVTIQYCTVEYAT
ncbi:TPA: hypothetical protein I8Z93_000965 [Legionella pneumophila]|nr:hypothetical protein [Legionella pneumophila]